MRGDLLFYRPKDFIGHLIAKGTNGPFCHVAVDQGDGTNIAADWSGIRVYIDSRPATATHLPYFADIPAGFAWLEQQVGRKYGFLDVLDIGARLLLHTSFYVAQPNSYDCSDLATRYLIACGLADWLGPLAQEPHLVSPNDLARRFHL
jgi:hypothetical protein